MTRIANKRRAVQQQASRGAGRGDAGAHPRRDRCRSWHAGVASLSIPAVAREAGVSVPTVYRHFAHEARTPRGDLPARRCGGPAIDELAAPALDLDELGTGARVLRRTWIRSTTWRARPWPARGRGRGAAGQHAESAGGVPRGRRFDRAQARRTPIGTGSRVSWWSSPRRRRCACGATISACRSTRRPKTIDWVVQRGHRRRDTERSGR